MKKNYIQPQTVAQALQALHIICLSGNPDLYGGTESADPNTVEIF